MSELGAGGDFDYSPDQVQSISDEARYLLNRRSDYLKALFAWMVNPLGCQLRLEDELNLIETAINNAEKSLK